MHVKTPLWKRRRLLQALGGLALTGAASRAAPLAPGAAGRVAVVGAGLAGLAAARLLQRQGIEVEVLEARRRVGGRVHTLDDIPGHPEGGANVVGPNYGRVIDAARSGGVELRRPASAGATGFVIRGQRVLAEDWPQSDANPLAAPLRALTPARLLGAALRDNPLKASTDWQNPRFAGDDIAADEYLKARGFSPAAIRLVAANNSYGNRIDDTSALSLLRVGSNFARARAMGQPTLEAASGNSRIPEALYRELGPRVSLGVDIQLVRQRGSEVQLIDSAGREHRANAVILALPVPALRQMDIGDLDQRRREAIARLEYHKLTQVHLLVGEPYWNESVPGSWWTDGPLGRLFLRPAASGGPSNLTVWINGDDCDRLAPMTAEEAGDAVLREVEAMLPEARGTLTLGGVKRWANDPRAGGSWVVWSPGQIRRYFTALQTPHGRLFFAGEHTADANPGMEGAMESGERAALEVLRMFL